MTGLRLDLPIRTSKRKREAKSPQQQRDMAQACADRNGYEIVRVHDSGRDESGKTMDRASLNAIMARVEAGETDGMIVALADRLGRAPIEEAMAYVRRLGRVGKLVLADMGGVPIDLNDPAQESNLVFQLQMARQYWLASQQRALRTREEAVAAGKFVGRTPFGYRRKGGRLYPDPPREENPVREAFLLAGSVGLHAAVDRLADAYPQTCWDAARVRQLFGDAGGAAGRVYLGESWSGEFVNREAHEGLVDIHEWTAAQYEARPRRLNGDYPLSRLVFCATCGAHMIGQLQSGKYRRYKCSAGSCVTIKAEWLEEHVRDAMREAAPALEGRYGVTGVREARAAVNRAVDARTAFAENTEYLIAVGPEAAALTARGLSDRVERAQSAFRDLAARAAQVESLPAADQLDDDEKLSRILRFVVEREGWRPTVSRGRGLPISERVRLDRFDDEVGSVAA